jgi:heme A synthase
MPASIDVSPTAAMAIRACSDLRSVTVVVLSVVILEFAVSVSAILTDIPISVAVAHNWLAGLLLLALLKLQAEGRVRA